MPSQSLDYTHDSTSPQPNEQVTPNNSDHEDPDYAQGDQTTPKRNQTSVAYSTPSQRSNRSTGVSQKTKNALEALHLELYKDTELPQEKHCLLTRQLAASPLVVCHLIRKSAKSDTVCSNILKLG